MSVIDEISHERARQIKKEGWTLKHDDAHDRGEMARAACSYAYEAGRTEHQRMVDARIRAAGPIREDNGPFPPATWPWSRARWKPTTPRRDLIKAAALIVAEIERLDRSSEKARSTTGGTP